MNAEQIEQILERYNSNVATPEEKALVEAWYNELHTPGDAIPHSQLLFDQQRSLDMIVNQNGKYKVRPLWQKLTAAASVILIIGSIVFLSAIKKTDQESGVSKSAQSHDIAPGGNKAILTLSNGSKIMLGAIKTGKLAQQGNMVINKKSTNQISYDVNNTDKQAKTVLYNTATTPRGGFFQFILSDGTKVWLNSGSEIKFPVLFAKDERKVELTGEAYFEVAHNARKPFRVVSSGQVIEVLGTHFDVSAYPDDHFIKTTLLEGSVKISSKTAPVIIKPGEQAQLTDNGIVVKDVDLDEVIAWKNGFFYFDDKNIQEVMKQLARWYDVDVRYDGKVSTRTFSGEISKNVKASQILDILSFKKIHYKIEDKIITIMP